MNTSNRPTRTELEVTCNEAEIDAIFATLDRCHLPGAAVGIAVHGKPVYRKGFGLANMELPVALSPAMRMRIGSTTKHFTCFAYMLLCEEGRAAPDDLIGKYLPELHSITHSVKLRQLMTNTSGLRDVYDICWQFNGDARQVPSAALLSLYRSIDDTNAAPGAAWIYNNGGFLILGAVIERITGQPLATVLRERIFKPIGMNDTLLREFDSDFLPNSATLHMTAADGRYQKSYLGTAHAGEGGMVSTVDDMLRWLAHMDAPVVGTTSTWEVMRAPQVLNNGISTGYGLGLQSGHYRGVETLCHGGGVLGGNSQMLKVPAAGLDIALMVNRHDVYAIDLANRILDVCLPALDAPEPNSSGPISTGTFYSLKTGRVIQLFGKAGQQIVAIDGSDWPFVRRQDGALGHAPLWRFIQQTLRLVGDPEQPTGLWFSEFGDSDELVRVPPAESAELESIAGRYRSEATDTEATLYTMRHGAILDTHGRFGRSRFALECLGSGLWRAKFDGAWPPGGILSFQGDRQSFRFYSARTRALNFRRCD